MLIIVTHGLLIKAFHLISNVVLYKENRLVERTRWRLIQKNVMRIKLDIYAFINRV
jgi:hypothetical protein